MVTDLMGVSSRAILDALVAGERNPPVLAALAQGRLKVKIPDLVEALVGRFGEHHAFMTRLHLEQIDTVTEPPAPDIPTLRAQETVRPTQPLQVIPAVRIGGEPRQQLTHRARVVPARRGLEHFR